MKTSAPLAFHHIADLCRTPASGNKLLNCRMYEQKFPEVDDLVMVRVKSIAEMGAYVSLLEYDNIEGTHCDITRGHCRSLLSRQE
jgi:hypothetical protein